MTIEELKLRKQHLREMLKSSRSAIPEKRRLEVADNVYCSIRELLKSHTTVVSYASFRDEFCTKEINRRLVCERKLALPRVVGDEIKVYSVLDIENDLVENRWGIMEPDPDNCKEVCFAAVSLVLVPAIGFDTNNHRIGYGGGFYDRFLGRLSKDVFFLGLGYEEQYTAEPIPAEPTDIPLSKVMLY